MPSTKFGRVEEDRSHAIDPVVCLFLFDLGRHEDYDIEETIIAFILIGNIVIVINN